MNFEELKLYLPKFLSSESEGELFYEIKAFLSNVLKNRYYTQILAANSLLYQGDGLVELPIYDYDEGTLKQTKCMVLSNTCDIDLDNQRNFPVFISYCPLINLSKYQAVLKSKGKSEDQIRSHINSIKQQEVTQMFYLPRNQVLENESIALLDRTFSCPNNSVQRGDLKSNRIFTLSDFGAYLLLLKLSIHFTRIQDKVERGTTH